MELNKIYNMDCLEFMKTLPDKCNENDIVFDPFMGGGTTCVSAKLLNRNYIGCEISPEYCKIAEERIKAISNTLF